MADPQAEHDPTMEEILQSIKRIIAEEDDAGDAAPAVEPEIAPEASEPEPDDADASVAQAVQVPEDFEAIFAEAQENTSVDALEQPSSEESEVDDILQLTEGMLEDEPEEVPESARKDILHDIDALTRSLEEGDVAHDATASASEMEGAMVTDADDAASPDWDEEDLLEEVAPEMMDAEADLQPEAGQPDFPAETLTKSAMDDIDDEDEPAPLKGLWAERMADDDATSDDSEADEALDALLDEDDTELLVEEEAPVRAAAALWREEVSAPTIGAASEAAPAPSDAQGLLSQATAAAATAAISHFMHAMKPAASPAVPSPQLSTRTGVTVEDLMVEALKPLLKQWLDDQLPGMVERIVREELQKLIPRG